MNSIHLGLRGCDEHRHIKWGDVQLLKDINGTEYLKYSERQTKTRARVELRNIRAIKGKAFCLANASPETNSVFVYKVYSERPSSMKDINHAHKSESVKR